jgi:hypothetical protein
MSRRIVGLMRGNIIAFVALFIALGGTSYAATTLAAGSVGTKQLKRGAVTTAKLKTGAVTAAKIRTGAVTTAKVAADAVTGDKVLESSLAKVPSAASADHAASADNATTLGGVSASVFGTALSRAGWDFHPQESTTTYSTNAAGILQRTSVDGDFVAPVQLPQGAQVTKLTFFYRDDGGAGTAGTLVLTRCNLAGSAFAFGLNATDEPVGYGQTERTFSPAQVVDNTAYAYSLEWRPDVNGCRLAGARIEYTLP